MRGLNSPFFEVSAQENGLKVGDVIKDFFFFFLLQSFATHGLQQDSSKCKIKDYKRCCSKRNKREKRPLKFLVFASKSVKKVKVAEKRCDNTSSL